MTRMRPNEIQRVRELIADAVREHPVDELGGIRTPIVLNQRQRARQGNPEVVMWCSTCQERAVPMRDGTCGFCGSKLRKIPRREPAAAPTHAAGPNGKARGGRKRP